ncbi:hypothetical protein SAY86_027981 [Trapa natans]|uniref:Acid phosphatase/vanadium-dependent haloperoxidase-related protein n=1 Tax=Trapa natans TaxID=22666 RepID=A0AAN7MET8_TRANT|nr:hypothetical protein SAY86_027981 [Trapa natans]
MYKERRWDSRKMLGSGGMPSSHSATVMALAVSIALQEGVGGSSFAIAIVLACIVMYDATGVRLHAGRQAELLNQIVCELPPEHPVSSIKPLRNSLGHTPVQFTNYSKFQPFGSKKVMHDVASCRCCLGMYSCISYEKSKLGI